MQDLYTENCKMLIKEMKDNPNTWKYIIDMIDRLREQKSTNRPTQIWPTNFYKGIIAIKQRRTVFSTSSPGATGQAQEKNKTGPQTGPLSKINSKQITNLYVKLCNFQKKICRTQSLMKKSQTYTASKSMMHRTKKKIFLEQAKKLIRKQKTSYTLGKKILRKPMSDKKSHTHKILTQTQH